MSETLKSIIENYRSGLLPTPNIQVLEKTFSNETIEFSREQRVNLPFYCSTFKNSKLINMKFINTCFESSYFEEC